MVNVVKPIVTIVKILGMKERVVQIFKFIFLLFDHFFFLSSQLEVI